MNKFYLKLLLIAFPFLMLEAQEEKLLVNENFQSWTSVASSATETSILKKTNFSNEDITYKLKEILVDPQGTNAKFTSVTTPGYLMCAKAETPYIEISPLTSITKVEFVHAATGGNRGYKLWKKVGNGNWEVVSEAAANPAGGALVSVNINAQNVALKFTNLNPTQNAYLTDLRIWGMYSSSAPQVNLQTAINIEGAGTVTRSVISDTYDTGTEITLTATPNFGYRFVKWTDMAGLELSVNPSYTFTLNADASLIAVFEAIQTYSLTLSTEGSKWGKVVLSPEPTNGKYEAGTLVTAVVEPNPVTTFNYWEDGSSNSSRIIEMTADKTIKATFDEIPFIVGWNFKAQEPRGSRAGDFYSKTDNQGVINLFKPGAAQINWLANTGSFNPSYPCVRMWTSGANFASERRYFEASFSTVGYKNIQIKSMVGANYQAYSVIKMQYSIDGTEYKDLAAIDITSVYNSGWADCNALLPTEAEGLSKIYIRWFGDTTSPLLGNANDNDGTALTNIYLYADEETLEDHDAPILLATVPVEGSSNASVNGIVTLTFNEKVKLGKGGITLNGVELSPVFGSKTATLKYAKLDYNTSYTLTVPAGALQDMSGNEFAGSTLIFTTMNRQQPIAKLFDAIVAQDGTGQFSSVQEAVNSVVANSLSPILIFIKDGKYTGHVDIPANKPFIHLIGQSRAGVIISDNRLSGDAEGQPNYHVSQGATLVVNSSDCYFENITFENSWGYEKQSGPQALAVFANNDRIIFNNCEMRSYQDTYLTSTKNISDRQYLKNCRIEGTVDYIYGGGDIFFDQCTLFNTRKGGYIVAPSHKEGTAWGYVFSNCVVDGNDGVVTYFGRPWKDAPKTVFINTKCITDIYPAGWHYKMGAIPAVFADYGTMDKDGNPVDMTNRIEDYEYDVKDANGNVANVVKGKSKKSLTDVEAAQYTIENVLGGSDDWNPAARVEPVTVPEIKIENNELVWNKVNYAISYIILKDDVVVSFTTDNNYELPSVTTDLKNNNANSFYTVVAVSEYGALSPASNAVEDMKTSIDENYSDTEQIKIQQSNGFVTVSNIPEGSSVQIYTFTGIMLHSAKKVVGELSVSLNQNAIIQISSTRGIKVFKVLKK